MKYLVSIIIVNYNGYHLLKDCLQSIIQNSYSKYEIIIADNGSTDNSIPQIKKDFKDNLSKIKILNLKKNLGPALARNFAFKKSTGDIIAFLDNDTKVDPNWITKIIPIFKNPKIGFIQSKLLLMDSPKQLDCVGERLGSFGFLKAVGKYGQLDTNQYKNGIKILSAKSAGMFIRRRAFINAGMFDPDYFIFMEETDLGWRVWLSGYQNILVSDSIVYHKFSSTKTIVDTNFNNYLIRFHGTKNYIQTLIKNLSFPYLIKILPIHIFLWFSLATFFLITGKFKLAKNIYTGITWNFTHLSNTLKKRKQIQSSRLVSDNYLFKKQKLLTKTKLKFYVNNFFKFSK
jgi:GT2 family glycosyltransferase